MSGKISRFRIDALHGRRTIDVPIADNTLILVGENGTGKSTVANFIYFFLTRQWHKMLSFEFNSIIAVIDDKELTVSRDEIAAISVSIDNNDPRLRHLPRSIVRQFEMLLSKYPYDELLNNPDIFVNRLAEIGYPSAAAFTHILKLVDGDLSLLSSNLREVGSYVGEVMPSQILYLPTYRRIEQDLKTILPDFEMTATRTRLDEDRIGKKKIESSYIELVKFGMEDVQDIFRETMNKLKDSVRNDLNNLTGTHLRDVIRGAYSSVQSAKIISLDTATIDAIFNRIDKTILPEQEQNKLRDTINKIKKCRVIADEDKVVAHFLIQLIDLHKIQQEKEKDIREFVSVCNNYLLGKRIDYNGIQFEISVHQEQYEFIDGTHSDELHLQMLSSGEKQIISLFSHIYLSGGGNYFVIIDEPELSLSVKWQRRFLTDILDTGRCKGLVAVTHSPFIFDNRLDSYTHSLEEFIA